MNPPDLDPPRASDAPPAENATEAAPRERILVADDEPQIRRMLDAFLTRHGYRVLQAADGVEALEHVLNEKPSLVVLDISMPHLDGLSVLKRLRASGVTTPVLIVSSHTEVSERVQGLKLGADDYLGKPFDNAELLARVQALLRRCANPAAPKHRFRLGAVIVDLVRMTVDNGAEEQRLSRTECAILDLLARNEGKPVSREHLLDVVWGYTYLPASRSLDTHVWRLRKKLDDAGDEPRWIKNVPGIGYRLDLGDGGVQPAAPTTVI